MSVYADPSPKYRIVEEELVREKRPLSFWAVVGAVAVGNLLTGIVGVFLYQLLK